MFNSSIENKKRENKKRDQNPPTKPQSIWFQEAFLLENSFYLSGSPTLFSQTNSKNKVAKIESSFLTNPTGYSKNT